MTTFAAIDIGSNSCRLKIARVVNHRLKALHEDREVTRLGGSVFETGLISPDAMATTLRALKRFQKAVQEHGVDQIRVAATAAMRDARNAQAFVAWVKAETGWVIEIISGLEEGRLIHHGVVAHEPGAEGRIVLIDVGGGSCEITLSDQKRIVETISVPLGAVRLTQEFLDSDPPSDEALGRMKQFITRELARAQRKLKPTDVTLVIATSGTAAALSEAHKTLGRDPGKDKAAAKVPAKIVSAPATPAVSEITTTRQTRRMATRLRSMNLHEREIIPGIGPRRAEIILAGAFVYAELLETFGLHGFRYSELGLRDGLLSQMLAENDDRATAHQQFETERWESVLATAQRYGVNPAQVEPLRAHAVQLFRELAPLHKLPSEYQTWLATAAVLSETGKFINHQGHHRHTQYLVSSTEMYGFTQQQRTVVSAIARYLGKTRPQPEDRAMRNIPASEHGPVQKCVVLLRLARALNQDRASAVVRVRAQVYPKRVLLELREGRTGAELELWSVRKEAAYFREVFGRELFATLL